MSGLTTTQAPIVERFLHAGQLFIRQPYELYSPENHQTWTRLFTRIRPLWEKYATERFLHGLESLSLNPQSIPKLDVLNERLHPLTGFQARAVSGYIPSYYFFECLRNRQFPTTITIRDAAALDYLPEPDIFHDVAGHVPMHTDAAFANALVKFGECAHSAVLRVAGLPEDEQMRTLSSILKGMARFFWFTVEFGLMEGAGGGLRAYGSGLLSSFGELEHSVTSPSVQRYPMRIEWAINQAFEIDHYQPLLFVIESFDQLFTLVDTLDQWIRDGRLNNVAPGEPGIQESDLKSFLQRVQPTKFA